MGGCYYGQAFLIASIYHRASEFTEFMINSVTSEALW